jgi:hypothetical protein
VARAAADRHRVDEADKRYNVIIPGLSGSAKASLARMHRAPPSRRQMYESARGTLEPSQRNLMAFRA